MKVITNPFFDDPMYNKSFEFDETCLIIRNDCEGTDFKLVPLYYVILTNSEDKIEIDGSKTVLALSLIHI